MNLRCGKHATDLNLDLDNSNISELVVNAILSDIDNQNNMHCRDLTYDNPYSEKNLMLDVIRVDMPLQNGRVFKKTFKR